MKLRELRGFSENFKLHTPVPQDLVPILAKDVQKQEEIKAKAQRNALEQVNSTKVASKPIEQTPVKGASDLKRDVSKTGQGGTDRPEHSRQAIPPRGPQATLPFRDRQTQHTYPMAALPPAEQGLSHRLARTQREKQAGLPVNVPAPLPIQTQKTPSRPGTTASRVNSSQGSANIRTPTSATSGRFNVKAHEFVPNPAASTFMPQPNSAPSPRAQAKARSSARASSPSEFFGSRKPLSTAERSSITENFNPLKRLQEKAEKDGKVKDYATNGGIAFAHATPVTWTAVKDGEEGKSYKDMFKGESASIRPSPRSLTASPVSHGLSHTQQFQNHHQQSSHGAPPMPNPAQHFYQGPPQPHLYPGMAQQLDEQRVHMSPSVSAYPTPRVPNTYGAYSLPIGQQIQGPVQGTLQYPGTMGPGHPQMFPPGGPQQPQFRPYMHNPQYLPPAGQPLAAPAMVQQGSQGLTLPQGGPVTHVPVYATGVPQYGPSQPNSGYPSPNRGPPMAMHHQSSYQGQSAQIHGGGPQYAQPFYSPQPPPPNSRSRVMKSYLLAS